MFSAAVLFTACMFGKVTAQQQDISTDWIPTTTTHHKDTSSPGTTVITATNVFTQGWNSPKPLDRIYGIPPHNYGIPSDHAEINGSIIALEPSGQTIMELTWDVDSRPTFTDQKGRHIEMTNAFSGNGRAILTINPSGETLHMISTHVETPEFRTPSYAKTNPTHSYSETVEVRISCTTTGTTTSMVAQSIIYMPYFFDNVKYTNTVPMETLVRDCTIVRVFQTHTAHGRFGDTESVRSETDSDPTTRYCFGDEIDRNSPKFMPITVTAGHDHLRLTPVTVTTAAPSTSTFTVDQATITAFGIYDGVSDISDDGDLYGSVLTGDVPEQTIIWLWKFGSIERPSGRDWGHLYTTLTINPSGHTVNFYRRYPIPSCKSLSPFSKYKTEWHYLDEKSGVIWTHVACTTTSTNHHETDTLKSSECERTSSSVPAKQTTVRECVVREWTSAVEYDRRFETYSSWLGTTRTRTLSQDELPTRTDNYRAITITGPDAAAFLPITLVTPSPPTLSGQSVITATGLYDGLWGINAAGNLYGSIVTSNDRETVIQITCSNLPPWTVGALYCRPWDRWGGTTMLTLNPSEHTIYFHKTSADGTVTLHPVSGSEPKLGTPTPTPHLTRSATHLVTVGCKTAEAGYKFQFIAGSNFRFTTFAWPRSVLECAEETTWSYNWFNNEGSLISTETPRTSSGYERERIPWNYPPHPKLLPITITTGPDLPTNPPEPATITAFGVYHDEGLAITPGGNLYGSVVQAGIVAKQTVIAITWSPDQGEVSTAHDGSRDDYKIGAATTLTLNPSGHTIHIRDSSLLGPPVTYSRLPPYTVPDDEIARVSVTNEVTVACTTTTLEQGEVLVRDCTTVTGLQYRQYFNYRGRLEYTSDSGPTTVYSLGQEVLPTARPEDYMSITVTAGLEKLSPNAAPSPAPTLAPELRDDDAPRGKDYAAERVVNLNGAESLSDETDALNKPAFVFGTNETEDL